MRGVVVPDGPVESFRPVPRGDNSTRSRRFRHEIIDCNDDRAFGPIHAVYVIKPDGELYRVKLGPDMGNNEVCQTSIPAGCWFGAAVNNKASFSFVGCTVSPGFHFDDFELGKRDYLVKKYPAHEDIIQALTRC